MQSGTIKGTYKSKFKMELVIMIKYKQSISKIVIFKLCDKILKFVPFMQFKTL